MKPEYLEKLISLGDQLGQAARTRLEAGGITQDDLRIINVASYTSGYIEALKLGSDKVA